MRFKLFFILIILIIFLSSCLYTKQVESDKQLEKQNTEKLTGNLKHIRLMFYNVENLFDTINDPEKNDDEYLPQNDRRWNVRKYYKKLNNIAKIIIAIGEWEQPAIVGLCEIENKKCITDLINKTALKKYNYQFIHKESPDKRGIDVAMLYEKSLFKPIEKNFIQVDFPNDSEKKTRDILRVKGILPNKDTLHVFINHWPSRWGGMMESETKRMFVASLLRYKVDSIFKTNIDANIYIVGDLNDYPENNSLTKVLKVQTNFDQAKKGKLYNLAYHLEKTQEIGSHKYQGHWGVLDQTIISGNLLNNKSRTFTGINYTHIYAGKFLLEKDEIHTGVKPFRTYIGFRYNNGYSDHLPVYTDLYLR